MKKPAVLLAVTDEAIRQSVRGVLFRHGYEVIESSVNPGDFRSLRHRRPDLVIIGPSPDAPRRGVEVAREIRQDDRRVPLILIVPNSSEELAIAALRAGINDYFKYPFTPEELAAAIVRCLSQFPPREVSVRHETTAPDPVDSPRMIGESLAMREVHAYARKVAPADVNVLITGETGTGKELTAELIHRNSPRCHKPFVPINCAAIPDSLMESELFGYEKGAFTGAHGRKEGTLKLAEGGTVFFDEIGDMSQYAQAKILRVIEGKEVHRLGGRDSIPLDVRFIAATNQDLDLLVRESKFRKDLYFRINVARIHLPPLRDRKEDILTLTGHYIRECNHQLGREVLGFTDEALQSLLRYDWPGNVRELRNLVEAVFINLPSRTISFLDLPVQFQRRLRETDGLPQDERERVLSALLATNWNKSQAAQNLHWSRMTLYRKMVKYRLSGGNEVPEGPDASLHQRV
jgi:DNA-binding NtrC family response regulator